MSVALHRVLQNWGEGESHASGNEGNGAPAELADATWLHRFFPDTFWAQVGGDFADVSSAARIVEGIGDYTWASTPELVADVQAWVDDPSISFGWIIKTSETTSFTSKRFDSKDNFISPMRPELRVSFDEPALARRFGQGCGIGPAAPLALDPMGMPALGNASFSLDLSGGPVSGFAFIYLADEQNNPPYPLTQDCFLYLEIHSAAAAVRSGVSPVGPLRLDASGQRRFLLPIPADRVVLGIRTFLQAFVLDPAANAGFRSSNGLELRIGV